MPLEDSICSPLFLGELFWGGTVAGAFRILIGLRYPGKSCPKKNLVSSLERSDLGRHCRGQHCLFGDVLGRIVEGHFSILPGHTLSSRRDVGT